MASSLGCSLFNALGLLGFNVASQLCEKMTQELLDGLNSCLQSLVRICILL